LADLKHTGLNMFYNGRVRPQNM